MRHLQLSFAHLLRQRSVAGHYLAHYKEQDLDVSGISSALRAGILLKVFLIRTLEVNILIITSCLVNFPKTLATASRH